jgi:hypothetical protein
MLYVCLVVLLTRSLLAFQISLKFIHLKSIHYKMLSEYCDETLTVNVMLSDLSAYTCFFAPENLRQVLCYYGKTLTSWKSLIFCVYARRLASHLENFGNLKCYRALIMIRVLNILPETKQNVHS